MASITGLLVALALTAKTNDNAQAQVTAANGSNSNGVTVSGQGWVVVKPDVVYFSAGVNFQSQTLAEGQAQAATKMDAISKALKAQGVKDEDIQTSGYNIYPNYVSDNTGRNSKMDGYKISSSFAITIRDITKAGTVIDEAGKAGADQISGITFGRDKELDIVKQARIAAMADAKAKADQLAQAGSFAIGSPINVIELGSSNPGIAYDKAMGAGAVAAPVAQSTIIESGQLKVYVNVQVTYAIK
jgi:hypothetical protein